MEKSISIIWSMIDAMVYFIGMCSIVIFIVKFFPIFYNLTYGRHAKSNARISEQKKKIIISISSWYLSFTIFITVLMHHMPGPDQFEHYYLIPNVYCTLWIMACSRFVRTSFNRELEPIRVLPKTKKIQNYILWFVLCSAIIYPLRNYWLRPIPYYITFPFLIILTSFLIVSWRNARRLG